MFCNYPESVNLILSWNQQTGGNMVAYKDVWSDEQKALAIKLYNEEGASMGKIAKHPDINKTRNAVAGMLYRLRELGISIKSRRGIDIRKMTEKERIAAATPSLRHYTDAAEPNPETNAQDV